LEQVEARISETANRRPSLRRDGRHAAEWRAFGTKVISRADNTTGFSRQREQQLSWNVTLTATDGLGAVFA
jgi:hypothetical protein